MMLSCSIERIFSLLHSFYLSRPVLCPSILRSKNLAKFANGEKSSSLDRISPRRLVGCVSACRRQRGFINMTTRSYSRPHGIPPSIRAASPFPHCGKWSLTMNIPCGGFSDQDLPQSCNPKTMRATTAPMIRIPTKLIHRFKRLHHFALSYLASSTSLKSCADAFVRSG